MTATVEDNFIECDTPEDAIRLLHAGKVRGIFWLGDEANAGYAERCVDLAEGLRSDFAVVRSVHPDDSKS